MPVALFCADSIAAVFKGLRTQTLLPWVLVCHPLASSCHVAAICEIRSV